MENEISKLKKLLGKTEDNNYFKNIKSELYANEYTDLLTKDEYIKAKTEEIKDELVNNINIDEKYKDNISKILKDLSKEYEEQQKNLEEMEENIRISRKEESDEWKRTQEDNYPVEAIDATFQDEP